jgi:uncharacterized protein YaaR (DUF327 family)
MSNVARVDSIEALKAFRMALLKFQEACHVALGDAEGEMQRMLIWLETEQLQHWQGQVRKCSEAVSRAKEAVRMKKIFKDQTGGRQSAVDEEKALALALKRLEEAQQKLVNTRTYARKLQKEILSYKGSIQRFVTAVTADLPVAVSRLESLAGALDAYVAASVPGSPEPAAAAAGTFAEAAPTESLPSMARQPAEPEPEEAAAEEPKDAAEPLQ